MFKKIIDIFRNKTITPVTNTLGVVISDNPELGSKFWKLLHDDTLTPEEEATLSKDIDAQFSLSLDFSEDAVLTRQQIGALRWNYRNCVKLCHPDKFPEKDEAIARYWFNHVEQLNMDKNIDQMIKVYSTLNFHRGLGVFPPPSSTNF